MKCSFVLPKQLKYIIMKTGGKDYAKEQKCILNMSIPKYAHYMNTESRV